MAVGRGSSGRAKHCAEPLAYLLGLPDLVCLTTIMVPTSSGTFPGAHCSNDLPKVHQGLSWYILMNKTETVQQQLLAHMPPCTTSGMQTSSPSLSPSPFPPLIEMLLDQGEDCVTTFAWPLSTSANVGCSL